MNITAKLLVIVEKLKGQYNFNVMRVLPFLRNLIICLLVKSYFRCVDVTGLDNIPEDGTFILVSNHRNGAIDGSIIKLLFPSAIFIVGKNLTDSPYLRILIGGNIDIYRKPRNDEERQYNRLQVQKACITSVEGNSPLVMFPEGTSKLGPTLLPLKKGIFYLYRDMLASVCKEKTVFLVPLGLHYEQGWAFRSAVSIKIGKAKALQTADFADVNSFMEEIRRMLLNVTVNYDNIKEQRMAESFASLAAQCCPRFTHAQFCRLVAMGNIPEILIKQFINIYDDIPTARIKLHPLVFINHPFSGIALAVSITPLIAAAFLLNFVPLVAAYFVSRRIADDDNVITLWRLIIFVPLIILQWVLYQAFLYFYFPASVGVAIFLSYLATTTAAIYVYSLWKCFLIKIFNLFFSANAKHLKLAEGIREWCKTIN
ncbi:MAG: 1-acyl-sn-glycerol-3-phosphate acyltransferase [Smithella sp.]